MFRFATPSAFVLLMPLAFAVWRIYRRRPGGALLYSMASRLPARTSLRAALAPLCPALAITGTALSIAALARPQTFFSRARRTADAIAIQMVVDVSGSMEALDMSEKTPAGWKLRTRLDAVKEAFARFVEKRPDDLIGLVTFGGFATTRCPLTTDHSALMHILKGVEVPAAGPYSTQEETLTAIGDALATACARLEKAELKTKIMVLLSDGVSNTGTIKPEEATRLAKSMGIKVYTIGVGSSGEAPFRVRDAFGNETIRRFIVEMDENTLRAIASETGGRYFNVKDPSGLQNALADIDRLEKTRVSQEVYNRYDEWFQWLLAPGLGLAVLGTAASMIIARRPA